MVVNVSVPGNKTLGGTYCPASEVLPAASSVFPETANDSRIAVPGASTSLVRLRSWVSYTSITPTPPVEFPWEVPFTEYSVWDDEASRIKGFNFGLLSTEINTGFAGSVKSTA